MLKNTSFVMIVILGALLSQGLFASEIKSYRTLDKRQCPILETPYRDLSGLDVGYIFPSDTGTTGWGDSLGVAEIDAWVRAMDVENDLGGEFELLLKWNSMILTGFEKSQDSDSSYSLSMGNISFLWSQRFLDGYGMQMEVSPGISSSLNSIKGDDMFCPVGLKFIKAFTPDFAMFLGAKVYPGFEQAVEPDAGLFWASRDDVVFKLGYPETLFEYGPAKDVRFSIGGRITLWPEYYLGTDDARKRLRYEEGRVFVNAVIGVTELTQLVFEGGYVFNREVSFEAKGFDDISIDDAPFVRLGIGGRM